MRSRLPKPSGMTMRAARSALVLALAAIVMVATTSAPTASATSQSMTPACDRVNVRSTATTSGAIRTQVGTGDTLTVTGTVSGGAWSTSCPTSKSGSSWYVITAINGTTVSARYGVSALYAATGVLKSVAGSTDASPTSTGTAACSGVNIRAGTSTSTAIVTKVNPADLMTIDATVTGSSWSAACPTSKSGSSWYRIVAINGQSVSSRFGVAAVYGATGVIDLVAASSPSPSIPPTAPPPSPSPTPTPAQEASASPTPATDQSPPWTLLGPPVELPTPTPTPAPSASPTPTPTPTPAPSASPTPTPTPSGEAYVPACDSVNVRTGTSTSTAIAVTLNLNSQLTVTGTVSGSSWGTYCPTWKSGSSWYAISEIDGAPVGSLFGTSPVYAATGVLQPAVTPEPTPTITQLGPSTTLFGRGWGHGVGLNQYGARGRALAGQTATEILTHYYRGITLGTMDPATRIRVLVLDNFATSAGTPLVIYGRNGSWTVSGVSGSVGADGRLRVYPATDGSTAAGRMVVETATGTVVYDGAAPARIVVSPADSSTTIQLWSKPTSYDLFRGSLTVVPASTTVDVVNTLAIDDYLRGVLPAEMSPSWPTEALKAQGIAARSYAAYRIRTSGTFDVYDDTRSQVYLGVRRENSATNAVVSATAGEVMYSGSAFVNALFHSTGGGATENNEYVFVSSSGGIVAGPLSYLRGSLDRDPSGAAYDAAAPKATWQTRAYTIAELSSIFGSDSRTSVGTLTGLDLSNRGVSGRLISVTLYGAGGTRTVSGSLFVNIFNAYRPSGDAGLWSTLVDVSPIP